MVKKKIQAIALLAITVATLLPAVPWQQGLNLPATKGTSNAGNFQPGVFPFDYTADIRKRIVDSPFTHLRLSLNVETAHSTAALASAWQSIHQKFSQYPNLRYEIFNEPFGYPYTASGAQRYLADMRYIIEKAGLPLERCVLDGLGYAQEVRLLVEAGWTGPVAYHVYPNWLPAEQRSTRNFAQHIEAALANIPNQILITEFGASLNLPPSDHGETSLIPGLALAIQNLRQSGSQITGTYYWHGWDNGDSYSIWAPGNAPGARYIQSITFKNHETR